MGGVNKYDELARRLGGYASQPSFSLPDIPEGYVRLTHVMPERSRQILSGGEPFIYRKHGLTGTTDSYSNNDSIEWLARTGDPLGGPRDGGLSNWSRNDFGDHMALMDLPADAHKRIALSHVFDDPIPNEAILGFIHRPKMIFEPNKRYDRAVIDSYGQQAIEKILSRLNATSRRPIGGFSDREVIPWTPPSAPPANDVW